MVTTTSKPSIEDVILRQQLYVEAVKNDQGKKIDPVLAAMLAALMLILSRAKFEKLNELNKKQFTALVAKLIRRLRVLMNSAQSDTLKRLYKFMQAEILVTRRNFADIEGKKVPAPYDGTSSQNAPLWAALLREVVPAAGETPKGMLATFANTTLAQVRRTLMTAYAEGWTLAQIRSAFIERPSGVFHKARNNFRTVTNTFMQQIVNSVGRGIFSMFFDNYRWVSVMDAVTTEICRGRDGRIYAYSNGPIPPAHYNCRSRVVPVRGTARDQGPDSFLGWLTLQPATIQTFALGQEAAQRMRNGAPQSELGENNQRAQVRRTLTIADYINRRNAMIR